MNRSELYKSVLTGLIYATTYVGGQSVVGWDKFKWLDADGNAWCEVFWASCLVLAWFASDVLVGEPSEAGTPE